MDEIGLRAQEEGKKTLQDSNFYESFHFKLEVEI